MSVHFSKLVNFPKMKVTSIKLPASLAACLSIPTSVCLPDSIYPSVHLPACPSIAQSVHPNARLDSTLTFCALYWLSAFYSSVSASATL
jgi:hypothetical protein